jgi:putative methyltransferase (TIGR04325 family)
MRIKDVPDHQVVMGIPVVASVLSQQKEALRILDFGGAAGLDFANIIAQGHNRLNLHYHVVDVLTACKVGQGIWDDPRISFSSEWPEGEFDIVYAYSAVHCIEDYKSVMQRMASYNPDVILLCKHPVYEGPTFARQQVNLGPGLELAQWALNFSEIETIFKKVGYILLYRGWGEDADTYNVRNYPETHRVGRTANMLFVRENKA